jgi:NAD(P)H-hydrate repair Nnr-like enzyme with NAD(P)H-hydrate dehydratase domain
MTIQPRIFSRDDARNALPTRTLGAHKWSVGSVMIVAGSPGYVGAPSLASMAAARSGAGIVHLVCNRSLTGSIAILAPETVFIPLPDGDAGLSRRLFESIGERAARCDAFLIGPGLGDDDYARNLVSALLGLGGTASRSFGFGLTVSASTGYEAASLLTYGKSVVVDADGLNALANIESWWEQIAANSLVLTPHIGELSRLIGLSTDEIAADPGAAATNAAARFRQTVVLKGSPSVVASGTELWEAEDAPVSLATAGTGDVLSGSIVAFLAQGIAPVLAANLALAVGSAAARVLEADFGSLGLVASDLPIAIAREMARLAQP